MKFIICNVLAITLFVMNPVALPAAGLSDTGQNKCYDNNSEMETCPSSDTEPFYGQDGFFDRNNLFYNDHERIIPQSFTKLDADGLPLPDTEQTWHMVRDNVTGLIWEVKTDENKSDKYTWDAGRTYCDSLILGNFSDWRLPTIEELVSITNYGNNNPSVTPDYFPNIQPDSYWSSNENGNSYAFYYNFINGTVPIAKTKYMSYHVIAVRCGNFISEPYVKQNSNGTVTDIQTGLTWYAPDEASKTWEDALSICNNVIVENEDRKWRMPNIKELYSITQSRMNGSITEILGLSTAYWSSTTDTTDQSLALVFDCTNSSIKRMTKNSTIFMAKTIAVTGGEYGAFAVRGDLNKDSIVDLTDAIQAMQVCAGYAVIINSSFGPGNINVDADDKIGLPEVIYILQETAGILHCG